MLTLSDAELKELHAYHTVKEIRQQAIIWQEAFSLYSDKRNEINHFLNKIKKQHSQIRVIFSGAGTFAYVGDVLAPYFINHNSENFYFESIATTDIVSCPKQYLKNTPTILVSFARSGNSPESLQAVKLAKQLVDDIYHLAITCASDGKLAVALEAKENSYVLLMPSKANDKAFAMTSSFTSMLLSALLVFDNNHDLTEKQKIITDLTSVAEQIMHREDEIQDLVNTNFKRVVYLGSGSLGALTREAQLKLLELTAGKIATAFDSSMGFRHGPKSFIDEQTIIFDFVSSDSYSQQYDIDIINEIHEDNIAAKIVAISTKKINAEFEQFIVDCQSIEDVYLSIAYIVFAQIFAVMTSLKLNNQPDTPSASGTVNRVVKGVSIHEL